MWFIIHVAHFCVEYGMSDGRSPPPSRSANIKFTCYLDVSPAGRVLEEGHQEQRKIACHEIDMWRHGFARNLEGVAMIHLPWLGNDKHGRHSPFMGNNEISRKILEHNSLGRIDHVPFKESFIGRSLGLRHEIGGGNVKNIFEHRLEAKRIGGPQGVLARAICQNKLATRQGGDRGCESKIRKKRGAVDVMRKIEKIMRAYVMFLHQTTQSRAVALIIIFLQGARGHAVQPEKMRQEQRDPLVDLRPQIAIGRIKRIVEIEDPGVDMRYSIGERCGFAVCNWLRLGL